MPRPGGGLRSTGVPTRPLNRTTGPRAWVTAVPGPSAVALHAMAPAPAMYSAGDGVGGDAEDSSAPSPTGAMSERGANMTECGNLTDLRPCTERAGWRSP